MTQTLLDLIARHETVAFIVIFVVSLGEALFIVGLFVPSTVVLIGAGALVGAGKLPFMPVLLLTAVGATVGDALSFWIGHHYKERIRTVWPFSRYQGLLDKGETFFRRHGGKSIFIGRFVPGVKAIVPGIAGMTDMNFTWFSIVNVTSAVVWAGVHIIPAAGIGLGLANVGRFDPRLAVVVGAGLVLAIAAYFLVKLTVRLVFPAFERWRTRRLSRDAASEGALARLVRRILSNDRDIVGLSVIVTVAALALASFGTLLVDLIFDPELRAADGAVLNWLQLHRSDAGDRVMTAITMSADGFVLTGLAVVTLVWLTFRKHYRVAGAMLVAVAASSLFVPIVKTLLHRARPTSLYSGADAFSFPSGHATLSVTIFGILAALYASRLQLERQLPVFAVAFLAATLVAFSRLYLGAHWLSDVVAGMSFGLVMTTVFMLLTRTRDRSIDLPKLSIVIVPAYLALYGFHMTRDYDRWLAAYAPAVSTTQMARVAWIDGGWRDVPGNRITLGGDVAEPFMLQTDLDPARLTQAFSTVGWKPIASGGILDVVVPSSAPLPARPAAALMHGGTRAVIALASTGAGDNKRYILRLWSSGFAEDTSHRSQPILVGSVSEEALEPILAGYSSIEHVEGSTGAAMALANTVRDLGSLPTIEVLQRPNTILITAR